MNSRNNDCVMKKLKKKWWWVMKCSWKRCQYHHIFEGIFLFLLDYWLQLSPIAAQSPCDDHWWAADGAEIGCRITIHPLWALQYGALRKQDCIWHIMHLMIFTCEMLFVWSGLIQIAMHYIVWNVIQFVLEKLRLGNFKKSCIYIYSFVML